LAVKIDGRDYSAIDWSLGGFRVKDWDHWDDNYKVGTRSFCNFELPFQGFNIAFDVETEVVRLDKNNNELAEKFVQLSERQTELLNHFVEQLVRGSMMPVQDTILRIDSPVTPVSTEPDPSPIEEVPVSRIPLQMICMSALYITIGLVLFALVSVTVYENFLSLKINTAVTASPVEPLISLVDGQVMKVNAGIDEVVNEGDSLIVIESPSLRKKIEEAKIGIEKKKIELEANRKRHALAIDTTGSPASKESRIFEIEVDRVQQEVTLAMQHLVALYDYKETVSISSPSEGRMISMFRDRGSMVKSGDTLGMFERQGIPLVHAYVTEEEVKNISLNLSAEIYILNKNELLMGTVVNIKSNNAQFTNVGMAYVPKNIEDRNIIVEIAFDPIGQNRYPVLPKSGLPVEVLFPSSKLKSVFGKYLISSPAKKEIAIYPKTRWIM